MTLEAAYQEPVKEGKEGTAHHGDGQGGPQADLQVQDAEQGEIAAEPEEDRHAEVEQSRETKDDVKTHAIKAKYEDLYKELFVIGGQKVGQYYQYRRQSG